MPELEEIKTEKKETSEIAVNKCTCTIYWYLSLSNWIIIINNNNTKPLNGINGEKKNYLFFFLN